MTDERLRRYLIMEQPTHLFSIYNGAVTSAGTEEFL